MPATDINIKFATPTITPSIISKAMYLISMPLHLAQNPAKALYLSAFIRRFNSLSKLPLSLSLSARKYMARNIAINKSKIALLILRDVVTIPLKFSGIFFPTTFNISSLNLVIPLMSIPLVAASTLAACKNP